MRYRLAIFFFVTLMSVATVRAQDVAVDFDRSVDFSKFKTYSWASGVPAKNPFIDRQITTGIEEHLTAKGLRRVAEGGDLSIIYIAAVDRDVQVSTAQWVTTGNWMNQTVSGISVGSQMWDVEVGMLLVCLSDTTGKNLLWRGRAKTMLDKRSSKQNVMEAMSADAKKMEKKIRKSLEKMFKQYPQVTSAR